MRTLPVVETLQALIETCSDAAHRFHACARHATNPLLRAMLNQCLQQRYRWRDELQSILNRLQDKKAGHDTRDPAASSKDWPLHAGWISVRCAFSPERPDDLVIEECRRGEQFVMARYQESLKRPDSAPHPSPGTRKIEAVVRRQLIGMRKEDRRIAAFGASRCMPARRRSHSSHSSHSSPGVAHPELPTDSYANPVSQARLNAAATARILPRHLNS